jgi:hypothetical protein
MHEVELVKTALAAALLALVTSATSACAPLASFRPASGLVEGRTHEVGGGAMVEGPRPFVDEPMRAVAQLWFSGRASDKLTLTGIGAFDLSAVALGGAARLDVARFDRFVLGGEVEAGWVWAAADVPMALRLFDQTWLYTAPRFGNRGLMWAVDMPLGLSARIYEGLMLRVEYRISWPELSYFERRQMLGAAAAFQF